MGEKRVCILQLTSKILQPVHFGNNYIFFFTNLLGGGDQGGVQDEEQPKGFLCLRLGKTAYQGQDWPSH